MSRLSESWPQQEARFTHPLARLLIQEFRQRGCQRRDIHRIRQNSPLDAIAHDFARPILARADYRDAHGQSFQHNKAARIMACWEDEAVGGLVIPLRRWRLPGEDYTSVDVQ